MRSSRAVELGATEYTGADKTLDVPGRRRHRRLAALFRRTYGAKGSPYQTGVRLARRGGSQAPKGVGFYYLDHLTHNVRRGNMDTWYRFYAETFNFREIRFFNIEGKLTGSDTAAR